jgi:hypothetical protein
VLSSPATTIFKILSEKPGYPVCISHAQKTSGNNCEKFQLKKQICPNVLSAFSHQKCTENGHF